MSDAVAAERARHPGRPVEVRAFDEHRAGLKPVVRRVWAKRGRRPVAVAEPRSGRLCVHGFVHPATGATEWSLGDRVDAALFAAVPARFAAAVGAGRDKAVIPAPDNAGWHGAGELVPPAGVRLVFRPPYSPGPQPAERRWPLAREAVANATCATPADLDRTLAARRRALADRPDLVTGHTRFHWWPDAA